MYINRSRHGAASPMNNKYFQQLLYLYPTYLDDAAVSPGKPIYLCSTGDESPHEIIHVKEPELNLTVLNMESCLNSEH